MKLLREKRGNVTIVFALSLVVIVTTVGGAIDLNNAAVMRHDMQDALDAAVLAGVRANASSTSTVASKTFSDNIPASYSGVTQSYTSSASSSSNASASIVTTSLTGTASYAIPTYALRLIGLNALNISATSTASAKTTTGATSRPCIYVLDPTGSQSLLVNSGANVSASSCEIDVKSTGTPAAMFNSGSTLAFKKVCVQGGTVTQNSTTVANLAVNCANTADPYTGNTPTPSSATCTVSNGNYNDAAVNLTPGVYCGWFNFNNSSAKVTFAPGVYVIKGGGWNVNGGTWTGNGVTFYFADTSKIQFNSGISATLSAPTSGTYKDLLFYEAPGLSKSDFIFNDSVANTLTGVIWLPSRTVTFNAKSGVASDSLSMIVWRLILNNTTWNLAPLGGTGSSGTSKVTDIRLVK